MSSGKITAAEFAALMQPLGPFETAPRLAVAVSGGADSMALCLLANAWVKAQGGECVALCVDHGLRIDSASEAVQVQQWLHTHSIKTYILPWRGPKPRHKIQETARLARHALLKEWCAQQGVMHLFLAHHLHDQVETFLMRVRAGSGPHGLACMPAVDENSTVRVLRPFLAITPDRLRATLTEMDQAWVEDPSNQNTQFERVVMRNLLPQLAESGLTPQSFLTTLMRLGEVRENTAREHAALAASLFTFHPAGMVKSLRSEWLDAGENGMALLRSVVCALGMQGRYPPSLSKIRPLWQRIDQGDFVQLTIHGCVVIASRRRNSIWIGRENRHIHGADGYEFAKETHFTYLWDDRFLLSGCFPFSGRIAPLGSEGLKHVHALKMHDFDVWPALLYESHPAVWVGKDMLYTPYLDVHSPQNGIKIDKTLKIKSVLSKSILESLRYLAYEK